MQPAKLTSLQLKLLNVFSFNPAEQDLLVIKKMLARYFADKLQRDIYQAMLKNNITEADPDNFL